VDDTFRDLYSPLAEVSTQLKLEGLNRFGR
jgi:hypothetical protein